MVTRETFCCILVPIVALHSKEYVLSILFSRDEKRARPSTRKPLNDLIPVENIESLFQEKKRISLLKQIQASLGLDDKQYHKLAQPLLHNLACYCQHLPEATLYYSQRGGLLDQALNRAEAGLQLLRNILILDKQTTPSEEQKLWLYTLFSAALLQGIGKLHTDYCIDLYDTNAHMLKRWQPLQEDLMTGHYYHYDFLKGDDLTFRNNLTPLLARQIMPNAGFSWILSNAEILAVWLALLQEDKDAAGPLAAILDRANAIAIQRDIQEFLLKYQELDARGKRLGTFTDVHPDSQMNRERLMGAEFMTWLTQGLESGKILINHVPVLMEVLPTGIVMSPQLFDMFAQEHLKFKNKVAVRQAFLAWNLHLLSDAAEKTIHSTKQDLSSIHINTAILPENVKVYDAKNHKIKTIASIDLVHNIQQHHFNPNELNATLNHLSSTGQWIPAGEHGLTTSYSQRRGR